jgi:hypothetical protein
MEAIYSRAGYVVGWLHEEVVYDTLMSARAFLHAGAVFTLRGRHLGRFEDRFFRDPQGDAVAFLARAEGGPPLPEIEPPAWPFTVPLRPHLPAPPTSPPAAMPTLNWSQLSWQQYLAGAARPEDASTTAQGDANGHGHE